MSRGNIERGGYKSEEGWPGLLLSEKVNLTENLKEGMKSTCHLVQTNFGRTWSLHICDLEYLQGFPYLLIFLPS